ncbi:MAG TPA: hypothetical protein VL172_08940, partial [Kofleriaceae bacterium]|nr:hypothetical protein [Kofleriaceae bacterium]
ATCDESGTKTCTCNSFTCSNGGCATTSTSCSQSCSRVTDGDGCGVQSCGGGKVKDLCCNTSGSCSVVCSTCYCLTCAE